jgi:CysZ protein
VEEAMLDAAVKALSQMFSPPFRSVLWRSIGLAVFLIVVLAIGIGAGADWLAKYGVGYVEGTVGSTYHGALSIAATILSIAAGLGVLVGAIFLMPAVTALVASFFVDEIADHVEQAYYPGEAGQPLPVGRALWEGTKTALLAVLVYLCATPFLLFAGFGLLIFFFATAFLLGREYFELAAMRFRPAADAKLLRKRHGMTVFVAGMFIAAFVSIPILNLATPLFGMAFMVHMHKKLTRREPLPR